MRIDGSKNVGLIQEQARKGLMATQRKPSLADPKTTPTLFALVIACVHATQVHELKQIVASSHLGKKKLTSML